ncbi:MAG: AAA family ATPase [Actinomycetota bacterium]|nr:AAA family ATPase [Actinomycetota bacterium]
MAEDEDLNAEQQFIERAYQRLDEARAAAEERMSEALGSGKSGTHQARTERDMVVRASLARMEQLDIGSQSLVFGRIDFRGDGTTGRPGATYHIGRLGVSGEDMEPMVVDWRAPVAEPFYRATGRHPMGLRRRRHFSTEGPKLLGIEDEELSVPSPTPVESTPVEGRPAEPDRAGEGQPDREGRSQEEAPVATGALLAALERSRSGRMRDIVATVQRQQDEVIRAPLPGLLVVQGGPGTGKTAVALHRAAYLLYTFRFPLERQGVLVVGPNQVFLRYIEQVLPSLGETGVALSTVEGLVSGVRPQATEPVAVSRLKGRSVMAQVVARAMSDRQRSLRRPVGVPFGLRALSFTPEDSRAVVSAARRRRGTHNSRRGAVETMVARHLAAGYGGAGPAGSQDEDLVAELRRHPAVVEICDRMWPRLDAEELLHDLFGAPALLSLACRGLLGPDEQALLLRERSARREDIPWTVADLPLLDEAAVLLGDRQRKSRPVRTELRTYGHIVVDEAQELSPMQLRVLARRSLSGSFTLVGDLGQASGPGAHPTWEHVVAGLGVRTGWRMVELDVNYRTPGAVADLANQVLAVAAPGLRRLRAARPGGDPPEFVLTGGAVLIDSVVEVAKSQLSLLEGGGTVGVVCPDSLGDRLSAAFGLPALSPVDARGPRLRSSISVVPMKWVKGLEFDGVVVVEPALIVAEADRGLRGLYVALSRTTKRLSVVHAEALPEPLVEAAARGAARSSARTSWVAPAVGGAHE